MSSARGATRTMSNSLNSADELGAMTREAIRGALSSRSYENHEEINAGRLRAVKRGSRTLILARDAGAWERSLHTLAVG